MADSLVPQWVLVGLYGITGIMFIKTIVEAVIFVEEELDSEAVTDDAVISVEEELDSKAATDDAQRTAGAFSLSLSLSLCMCFGIANWVP